MARAWEAEGNAADAAAAFSFTANQHGPSSDLRRVLDTFTLRSQGALNGDSSMANFGQSVTASASSTDGMAIVSREIASATFVLAEEAANSFESEDADARQLRKRSSDRLAGRPVKRSRDFVSEKDATSEGKASANGSDRRASKDAAHAHHDSHHKHRSSRHHQATESDHRRRRHVHGSDKSAQQGDDSPTRKTDDGATTRSHTRHRTRAPQSDTTTRRRHHHESAEPGTAAASHTEPQQSRTASQSHASASSELGLRYTLGGFLGEGSFAVVRKAFDQVTRDYVAIKCVYTSKAANNSAVLHREIEAGKMLHHENIVRFREVSYGRSFTFLVFDMVKGVDLLTYISANDTFSIPEMDAHRIFTQAMGALAYCHRKGVAHRDIKLENIMVDPSNDLKTVLLDFGLCLPHKQPELRFTSEFCGSADYCAPEILLCHDNYDSHASDIWALAVVLFTLVFGTLPFNRERRNQQIIYEKVHPLPSFPTVASTPQVGLEVRNLLMQVLRLDAKQRLTAEQVLSHNWFVHGPQ